MISGGGVVVCVGSVLQQELDELCCATFTLPCESLSGRLVIVSRVWPPFYMNSTSVLAMTHKPGLLW